MGKAKRAREYERSSFNNLVGTLHYFKLVNSMDAKAGINMKTGHKKIASLFLSIASCVFTMHVYAADSTHTTDSTHASFRPVNPATVKAMYPSQTVPTPANEDIVNQNFATVPLCPGRTGGAEPTTNNPSCPDINNRWPGGVSIVIQGVVFCPDFCRVDRVTNPAVPSYPLSTSVAVTSFTNPTCPTGYVKIADFNLGPAIKWVQPPQGFVGPFDDSSKLNRYRNDSDYDCSIWYNPSTWQIDWNRIGNFYTTYCSADTAQNTQGPDNPPQYWIDMMIGGYLGQYVSWWTWSPFAVWSGNSCYATPDWACQGNGGNPNIACYVWHRDKYYHYYRLYYCKAKPPGWYFVNSLQTTSILCGRVKSTWKERNYY